MRIVLLLLVLIPSAFCASRQCVELVSSLSETCEAFEYASDRVLDLEVDKAEVTAQAEREQETSLSRAFNRISTAEFTTPCCDLISSLNASRCFCQEDVVKAFQSEISDELLAFTLFSAARSKPDGCGGLIWASLDEDECLLLGPASDDVQEQDCRSLRDELRDRRLLRGRFGLLEEALDSTGVLDEISSLRQFVLFAPADSAFRRFARTQNTSIAEILEDVEFLREVLRRHVVYGDDVVRLERNRGEVRTLQGSTITIRRTRAGDLSVQGFELTQEDVELCRGVVHVIDGVMWPLSPSNKAAREDEEATSSSEDCETVYETLVSLEEAFGVLLGQINLVPAVRNVLNDSDSITLFAYSSSDDAVVNTSGEDSSLTTVRSSLERLIVEGDIPSAAFVSGQRLRSISDEPLNVIVARNVTSINGVALTEFDITACNGRIHVSANVIPPETKEEEKDNEEEIEIEEEEEEENQDIEKEEEENEEETEGEAEPCGCTEDGMSNGVDTGRPGCAQHALQENENLLFCYVKDPQRCQENGKQEIYLSGRTPPAYWRPCNKNEATLPTLNEAVQTIDFLEHIHKYFIFTRLQRNLLREAPITIFVPDQVAINIYSLENLLDEGEQGEEQVRKLLRRHILEGDIHYDELQDMKNITMSDGTLLSLSKDSNDGIYLDNLGRISKADILCSNGVIHVIDNLVKPELLAEGDRGDPCECIEEDEELPSGRLGCRRHVAEHAPFCYVKNPEECGIGIESAMFPGRKWRSCVDPCRCSNTGLSGRVSTGRKGCSIHVPGDNPFCYIAEPKRCKQGRSSNTFPGARWKYCGQQTIRSRAPSHNPSSNPCDCSESGYSGETYTGRVGCGRFNDPFVVLDICYVSNPSRCPFAFPSFEFNGAAWRFC